MLFLVWLLSMRPRAGSRTVSFLPSLQLSIDLVVLVFIFKTMSFKTSVWLWVLASKVCMVFVRGS